MAYELVWVNLVTCLVVSFAVSYFLVRYDHMHNHITSDHDLFGVQKFHTIPVPRIGGVAVFAGLIMGAYLTNSEKNNSDFYIVKLVLICAPSFFIGLAEDITKKIGVRARMIGQVLSGLMGVFLLDAVVYSLDVLIVDKFLEISWVAILFTCFAVAGVSNSFNIIDGYNGLSGAVGVTIMAGLWIVAAQVGDQNLATASAIGIGSIIGFLFLNYPKGRIFLGDGGAYLIGCYIAELGIMLVRNNDVSVWFPFLLVLYPIIETLFTIVRRTSKNFKAVGSPDAEHMHQLVYKKIVCRFLVGNSVADLNKKNALTGPIICVYSIVCSGMAVFFWDDTYHLIVATLAMSVLYIFFYFVLKKSAVI